MPTGVEDMMELPQTEVPRKVSSDSVDGNDTSGGVAQSVRDRVENGLELTDQALEDWLSRDSHVKRIEIGPRKVALPDEGEYTFERFLEERTTELSREQLARRLMELPFDGTSDEERTILMREIAVIDGNERITCTIESYMDFIEPYLRDHPLICDDFKEHDPEDRDPAKRDPEVHRVAWEAQKVEEARKRFGDGGATRVRKLFDTNKLGAAILGTVTMQLQLLEDTMRSTENVEEADVLNFCVKDIQRLMAQYLDTEKKDPTRIFKGYRLLGNDEKLVVVAATDRAIMVALHLIAQRSTEELISTPATEFQAQASSNVA